jgi:probable HAF family extracellular repeat protein
MMFRHSDSTAWRRALCAGQLVVVALAVLAAGLAGGLHAQTRPVDLGTLGGAFSRATAVNDNGQIIGNSSTAGDATQHAFSWTAAGGMVDLGTLGGSFSEAIGVNATGQVVGYSDTGDVDEFGNFVRHAFSWTAAGGMVDLGSLGGNNSLAVGVNARGQVVGTTDELTRDDTD